MPAPRPDYYEVLGIKPNAKLTDVHRAYVKWVAEFKKDTTPPDPRRESLLKEAFEVLSDETRRDAYDEELRAERTQVQRAKQKSPAFLVGGIAVVAIGAVATYFAIQPSAPKGPPPKSAEEILNAMGGAVSALTAFDMSGKATPLGGAFVVRDKTLVASCTTVAPGAQLVLTAGTKQIPVRVATNDTGLGLCKLVADGYAGEPLVMNLSTPAAGEKVYTTVVSAKGEVTLKDAKVAKVVDDAHGKAINSSYSAGADSNGAPMLDAQGRVIAVATVRADGSVVNRMIPRGWLEDTRVAEPKPYQPEGEPAGASAAASGAAPAKAPPGLDVPKGVPLSSQAGMNAPRSVSEEYGKRFGELDKELEKAK